MSAINRDVLEVRQAEKDFALHGEKERRRALAPAPGRDPERVGRLKADGDADQALGMAEVEQVLAAYPKRSAASSSPSRDASWLGKAPAGR